MAVHQKIRYSLFQKALLFFMLFLTLIFGSPNIVCSEENVEDFEFVNSDVPVSLLGLAQSVDNVRLFFVQSRCDFIRDSGSDSPLQEKIPGEIDVPPWEKRGRLLTIITQKTPTKSLSGVLIEGGTPGLYILISAIVGAIVGFILALVLKKSSVEAGVYIDLAIFCGFIAFCACLTFMYNKEDNINLFVDNSLNEAIYFELDTHPAIQIPAMSNMRIGFEEGIRQIRVLKVSTNEVVESFTIKAYKFRDNSGKKIKGCYIYNIGGRNSYNIVQALYK